MGLFDNYRFPYFTIQELNLDWLLTKVKNMLSFMPEDGNPGDVLTRKTDGAAWEPPTAVNVDINSLPQDTAIVGNDKLIFYDDSVQANRKITPPDLLDSMSGNTAPLMDGTAAAGTSKKPARSDHRHPTDTTRAPYNESDYGYCKMPDGTLIEYGYVHEDQVASNDTVTMSVTFLQTFIAVPAITISHILHTPDVFSSSFENNTNTGFDVRLTNKYTGPLDAYVSWIAIGRWKF